MNLTHKKSKVQIGYAIRDAAEIIIKEQVWREACESTRNPNVITYSVWNYMVFSEWESTSALIKTKIEQAIFNYEYADHEATSKNLEISADQAL